MERIKEVSRWMLPVALCRRPRTPSRLCADQTPGWRQAKSGASTSAAQSKTAMCSWERRKPVLATTPDLLLRNNQKR